MISSQSMDRRNIEFYERFAEHYQRIYACVDADETVRQWKILLERHERDSTERINLVDVGCGPGWHLSAWAKQRFNVAGIDSSSSMLSAAERNFSLDNDSRCRVYLCDIRELAESSSADRPGNTPNQATYDVAVAHFNFLNLFAPEDLLLVFGGVASLVRPGGIWLVDCSIPPTPPQSVREDYGREGNVALQCIGDWSEASKAFYQRWLGTGIDSVEVYWFHCLQVYEQCAASSGWVTESRYEWHPNERSNPWWPARGESERVVTVYRRSPKDESIERNWSVEDGQKWNAARMADRET